MRYFLSISIVILGLSACGYKGNLYLPKEPTQKNEKKTTSLLYPTHHHQQFYLA